MNSFSQFSTTIIPQCAFIRTIDFSNPADIALHDKMVALVERMLTLNKQRAEVKTDHEKNLIERQIEGTDKQIDALASGH